MASRATAASSTIIATRATITVSTPIGRATTGFAAGAEVAELAGEFGIERIVEADGDGTVTRRWCL